MFITYTTSAPCSYRCFRIPFKTPILLQRCARPRRKPSLYSAATCSPRHIDSFLSVVPRFADAFMFNAPAVLMRLDRLSDSARLSFVSRLERGGQTCSIPRKCGKEPFSSLSKRETIDNPAGAHPRTLRRSGKCAKDVMTCRRRKGLGACRCS